MELPRLCQMALFQYEIMNDEILSNFPKFQSWMVNLNEKQGFFINWKSVLFIWGYVLPAHEIARKYTQTE